jgi:hypothetical protein
LVVFTSTQQVDELIEKEIKSENERGLAREIRKR